MLIVIFPTILIDMPEKLNTKENVYKFLQSHVVGVLSTVSPDGVPYGSPIYYIVDEELNFFFVTKSGTKKSENMQENEKVALTIVAPSLPITIQVRGNAVETNDVAMYTKMAEMNAEEKGGFHWPPPIHKLHHSGDLLMYKLTPTWLRVGDFSESQDMTDTKEDIFYLIISE